MKTVALRIGHGVFTVRPVATLITVSMLITLLGLGTWQLQRLHWKQNLLATIDRRTHEEPVDVTTITDASDAEYRPATASGLFQYDKELYLAAISQSGEGGYHVLTPLQLDDGRVLLVDRGWVPYDHKDPATRRDGQLIGPVSVKGLLRLPHHRWMQPDNDPSINGWYGIDLTAMAKATNEPAFLPYILEADATPNAGGYPIGGQTHISLPNNHFAYALTWYGIAVVLIIIYGVSGYRKVS